MSASFLGPSKIFHKQANQLQRLSLQNRIANFVSTILKAKALGPISITPLACSSNERQNNNLHQNLIVSDTPRHVHNIYTVHQLKHPLLSRSTERKWEISNFSWLVTSKQVLKLAIYNKWLNVYAINRQKQRLFNRLTSVASSF